MFPQPENTFGNLRRQRKNARKYQPLQLTGSDVRWHVAEIDGSMGGFV